MTPRNAYLLVYNSVQLALWTTVLVNLLSAAYNKFPPFYNTDPLHFATRAQKGAWFEVLHAILGLGGGVSTAFVQCLGRYVILVFVIDAIPPVQHTNLTFLLLLSWSLADVIRYVFYLSSFLGGPGRGLLWLRYSMFVILYPVGIVSEWLIYYHTLDFVDTNRLYEMYLPNSWNFSFDFGVWNRLVLFLYLYFGPYMFLHMVRQRRRKLT